MERLEDSSSRGPAWNLVRSPTHGTFPHSNMMVIISNYGRPMSPTAEEVVTYFVLHERMEKRSIESREALLGDSFVTPLSAVLSCLAAFPSQVDYLVPHPLQSQAEIATNILNLNLSNHKSN